MNTVISKDGTRIAYERSGDGPAVVLVDSALGSRSFGSNVATAPLLAPHFKKEEEEWNLGSTC
jgi:hypothetical protein